MTYKNVKTGVVMDLPEDFSGSNWEPVEAPKTPHRTEEVKEPKKKATKKKEVRNVGFCDSTGHHRS